MGKKKKKYFLPMSTFPITWESFHSQAHLRLQQNIENLLFPKFHHPFILFQIILIGLMVYLFIFSLYLFILKLKLKKKNTHLLFSEKERVCLPWIYLLEDISCINCLPRVYRYGIVADMWNSLLSLPCLADFSSTSELPVPSCFTIMTFCSDGHMEMATSNSTSPQRQYNPCNI